MGALCIVHIKLNNNKPYKPCQHSKNMEWYWLAVVCLICFCGGGYIAIAIKDKRWYLVFWFLPLVIAGLFAVSVDFQKAIFEEAIRASTIQSINNRYTCTPINETLAYKIKEGQNRTPFNASELGLPSVPANYSQRPGGDD
jgi:hypothetical protein